MELKNKIIVVTGAASGIGRAMCLRYAEEGAKHIACVDRDLIGAEETAQMMGGKAYQVDVSIKDQITAMIDAVEMDAGPIDLFCSNAGISVAGGVEVDDDAWQKIWEINVMSHVWAARHLLRCWVAQSDWFSPVRGDKTCGNRVGRMDSDELWRPRDQSFCSLSSGSKDRNDPWP